MAPLVRGGFPTRKRGREVLSRREEHGNRMVSRPIYFTDTERSLPFPRLCHRRPGTERGSNESVIGGADLPFGVLFRTLIVCFLVGINVSKGARICSASRERARLCWGLSWFQDLPRPVGPTGATKTLRWGNFPATALLYKGRDAVGRSYARVGPPTWANATPASCGVVTRTGYPLSSPQRGQAVLRGRAEFKATRVGAPSGPSTDLEGMRSPVSKTGAREGVWVRIPPAPLVVTEGFWGILPVFKGFSGGFRHPAARGVKNDGNRDERDQDTV